MTEEVGKSFLRSTTCPTTMIEEPCFENKVSKFKEIIKVVILQSVSDCIIIKSKNIMMNNTLFHHIGFDIVNNILQYHGKETYVDARNNRYVRFTKEYISKHPLNQLQRIRAYKSIQTFIKMFTAELQTVDMQKIELTRPYRRYIVGFVNRITYIDKRFYNYKGRFCYEGGRRVIIMKDFHSRCKYNIYASYLYINKKRFRCRIHFRNQHFYLTLDDSVGGNYIQRVFNF